MQANKGSFLEENRVYKFLVAFVLVWGRVVCKLEICKILRLEGKTGRLEQGCGLLVKHFNYLVVYAIHQTLL